MGSSDHKCDLRFWRKVRFEPNGCVTWTAGTDERGYGRFRLPDRTVKAHRMAYALLHHVPLDEVPPELGHYCPAGPDPSCVLHVRGVTTSQNRAEQRPRTHCVNGHLFTPENTYTDPRGRRQCRKCRNARWMAMYWRQRA